MLKRPANAKTELLERMMNEAARLDAIDKREQAATEGPWEVYLDRNIRAADPRGGHLCPLTNSNIDRGPNYQFVAHARQDIPWLRELVERTQRERDELRELLLTLNRHRRSCRRDPGGEMYKTWHRQALEAIYAKAYDLAQDVATEPAQDKSGG